MAFEFYLNQRQTVDENDDIVALATVGGVDRELVNHLKLILAPVAGIDEWIVDSGTIVASESLLLAQVFRNGKDIWRDILLKQFAELIVGKSDIVEALELLAEILLERIQVADIATIGVFQIF